MADIEITVQDNSGEILRAFNAQLDVVLDVLGLQAENHAKQIISDFVAYGNDGFIALPVGYHEKDTSRVDTGQLRNSVTHAVHGTDVYIGSNLQHAVWNEIGTGIYASQPGGRQSPWAYQGRDGKWHMTRGLFPIHFMKRAASNYTDEYKKIIENFMTK